MLTLIAGVGLLIPDPTPEQFADERHEKERQQIAFASLAEDVDKWPAELTAEPTSVQRAPEPEIDEQLTESIKYETCVFLEFRNTIQFALTELGHGNPYDNWLADVQVLEDRALNERQASVPLHVRNAPRDLIIVAFDRSTRGKDTDFFRSKIPELKKAIGYAEYLASKQSDHTNATSTDSTPSLSR